MNKLPKDVKTFLCHLLTAAIVLGVMLVIRIWPESIKDRVEDEPE